MHPDNLITEKRWTMKPTPDDQVVAGLSAALNIGKNLATLLVQRGITNFEEAKKFFRPALEDLHDPFLMHDMDKAVLRIEQAIKNNENILIFGDYDVDGTTSVALVYSFFKTFYNHLDYYLPDRYKEGYGVSTEGIDYAAANKMSLIIALDCGIKSNDKVEYAREKDIDFIICDHHRPGEKLPAAAAILDPKKEDCSYPYKELSGCGIGFKLIQAYAQKHAIPFRELEQYLDLVAISTAADIVPITGENRVLVYYGLQQLNNYPRPGIKAILDLVQSSKFKVQSDSLQSQTSNPKPQTPNSKPTSLTVSEIVYIIGPRINAAGRIQDARHAVDLLISANPADAMFGSIHVNDKNNQRRDLDSKITEEALEMIRTDGRHGSRKTTVLYSPEWHKGVIGIVAARLTEKYYRPTIILTESNGFATGSARSVKDFDIYNAIESCSDLLEQFGGHMYAAGLTMKVENIEPFMERFEEVVSASIEDRLLVQEIEIDGELKLNDITPSFYNVLRQFAPFGPGNPSPIFKTEGVRDTGMSRIVGNNHLKLNLADDDSTRFGTDGIAFNQGQYYPFIARRIPFSVCYSIEENTFNGRTTLQLNVKDIKIK